MIDQVFDRASNSNQVTKHGIVKLSAPFTLNANSKEQMKLYGVQPVVWSLFCLSPY